MNNPWLSIIIPVLDEEGCLDDTLSNLEEVLPGPGVEVIVVDGGSRDRTLALAREHAGVKVLSSSPGRGPQMNRGAEEAAGRILLFLHADVLLPEGAGRLIEAALEREGVAGGCFKVETVAGPGRSRLFKLLLKTADWRSRFAGYPYGDQAVFVRRKLFERLGGFRDFPIMEDLEFARRLRRAGRIVRLDAAVQASGRRWEKNMLVNFLKLKTLPLLFRLGVPPRRLTRFYGEVR